MMHKADRQCHWIRLAAVGLTLLVATATNLLVGRACAQTPAHPVELQIGDLREHPDKYAGQTVRLTGKLTECAGWECSICPEAMTSETADAKRCLPLEFRPLLKGTGFGETAVEGVFRFASVMIDARFDPACLRKDVLCTDRATLLLDADVVAMLQRRSSRSGLWLGRRTGLTPLAEPIAAAVIAAAYDAGYPRGTSRLEKDPALAAATRQFDPSVKAFGVAGALDIAIVCWAPPLAGADEWPDSAEGALNAPSIMDHYTCNEVRRVRDGWIVQVR